MTLAGTKLDKNYSGGFDKIEMEIKFHDFRLFKAATLFVLHLVLVPFRHGLKSLKLPEYRLVVCIV